MRPFIAAPARAGPRRDLLYDISAVVLAAIISLGVNVGHEPMLRPAYGLTTGVLLGISLLLLLRRRAPEAVAWATAAAALLVTLAEWLDPGALVREGDEFVTLPWWPPSAPFAAYSLMAYGRNPRRETVPIVVLALAGPLSPLPDRASELGVRSMLLVVIAALLGKYVAARRGLFQALLERAERAEREQHLLAERARADERARLAAEMHDIVTHRVSLMVMQAGALSVSSPSTGVRTAADELRTTGCLALEELRDLVGLLRTTAGDARAARVRPHPGGQPPAPRIDSLVEESRSVGVDVELVEQGDPGRISPVVGRTAHRVVQEALTNVRKHAPGSSVNVTIRYGAEGVRVSVSNTAPTREVDRRMAAAGSGSGLAGLRERVALMNGRLSADPDEAGGFRVEADLPAYVPSAETWEPVR